MAKAGMRVRTKKNPAFTNLQKQLKAAGRKDLRADLRKAIQKEGAPAVAALRAATMGVNPKVTYITGVRPDQLERHLAGRRSRSTGLRRRVANAITTQVLVSGIRIRVNGRKVLPQNPRGGDNLARYLIAGKRKWGAPLFGNREVWTHFQSQDIWFSTLNPHLKAFRKAVQGVMDDTVKKLGG